MAVTYAQFIERFPELAKAPQAVVETELAAAARRINAAVWGAQANDAIGLLAAHSVALRPNGEFARLAQKGEGSVRTTYGEQYMAMARNIISGDRVP
ncbi:MAG: DUF4054 domain-containing protein [Gammaproteobacteria bacterium]|nr:DUF4054 domain-containing protein [Gammaproteobacteria bacterium]NIR85142.1 DUF4054 domain-containing protein [Gammaproteobacteria bacterium]NIU06191.1 DUF4054 domain-containing protein [Gammaproteobacteria bacterium]NIX87464.1 DUF4054 domain-containing protein [Gammaproteobacteria bacterium]